MPELIEYILVFVVGACIGSFLNVVIYRVPNKLSLFPSSRCPKCDSSIKPYHNIPIFGWLIVGGKCASCRQPISWRYPAIELLTALVFVLVFWQVGVSSFLPVAHIFSAAIIALIFIDAEHMILPNVITYPLFVFALIARFVLPLVMYPYIFSDTTVWPIAGLHAAGYNAAI